ncbi:hypothetical protein chiPu_0020237 [Chiloscyllium punctatum]|uniref:Uncharacterized protein n=1 Tax=Chiloscyllium punctatum TaxID=137246 RepID=A0A401RUF5_CHIPU|nr:hypothetical protein [Chiloscyllium punctatum]
MLPLSFRLADKLWQVRVTHSDWNGLRFTILCPGSGCHGDSVTTVCCKDKGEGEGEGEGEGDEEYDGLGKDEDEGEGDEEDESKDEDEDEGEVEGEDNGEVVLDDKDVAAGWGCHGSVDSAQAGVKVLVRG